MWHSPRRQGWGTSEFRKTERPNARQRSQHASRFLANIEDEWPSPFVHILKPQILRQTVVLDFFVHIESGPAMTPINDRASPVPGQAQLPNQQPVQKHRNVPSESEQSGGFLLQDGNSTRYIDEFTFSRVLEKEDELQSAVETPESHPRSERNPMTIGFDGLLSTPHGPSDNLSLFPSRWQAAQLWQSYLNNVDGLLKILHVPTVQPKIFAAINNPKDTPRAVNALLFSIYFAAVTSLRPPDVEVILGQGRSVALDIYQRGLEVYLHMGSFLDSPTIISLQAMAIYLMCRRHRNSGRSGWILNGMLMRAAQSIGLHREGEHFKLSPFECEIRRRLWWQIMGSDGRDRLQKTMGCPSGPPAAPTLQPRWTEMTHFLVASEMYQALQQFNTISMQSGNDKMIRLEELLNTVKNRINERYLQYCDANIPIQKCAFLLGRLLTGKFEVLVKQQYLRGLTAEQSTARATDETLTLACETIESGIEIKTDELLSNYQVLFSAFTDYHLRTYALWHLCARPEAAGADKTWVVVNKLFVLAETEGWPTPGAKWNVLRELRERAAGLRQTLHPQPEAGSITAANSLDILQQLPTTADLEQPDQSIFDATGAAPMLADGMLCDFDSLCFPEWGGYSSAF
ncbi:putative c6 transcription protein [Seiridium unicorne]|uniref:C6 transcription protein n=1 Tax=Seiridium unicorne TaxID=138068 RepID=A0ABR2V1P4_9PEZI